LGATDSVCPVCKIDPSKDKKTYTKEEKKIAYWCRTLHVIGFLSIIGGCFGAAAALFGLLSGRTVLIAAIIDLFFAIIFLYFGLSLRKFAKWCYIAGIVLYSISIIFALLEPNLLRLVIDILFLYYLASPTSRKILYREL
jgi:hypothetical protein